MGGWVCVVVGGQVGGGIMGRMDEWIDGLSAGWVRTFTRRSSSEHQPSNHQAATTRRPPHCATCPPTQPPPKPPPTPHTQPLICPPVSPQARPPTYMWFLEQNDNGVQPHRMCCTIGLKSSSLTMESTRVHQATSRSGGVTDIDHMTDTRTYQISAEKVH
jgi:hypothetical protein